MLPDYALYSQLAPSPVKAKCQHPTTSIEKHKLVAASARGKQRYRAGRKRPLRCLTPAVLECYRPGIDRHTLARQRPATLPPRFPTTAATPLFATAPAADRASKPASASPGGHVDRGPLGLPASLQATNRQGSAANSVEIAADATRPDNPKTAETTPMSLVPPGRCGR